MGREERGGTEACGGYGVPSRSLSFLPRAARRAGAGPSTAPARPPGWGQSKVGKAGRGAVGRGGRRAGRPRGEGREKGERGGAAARGRGLCVRRGARPHAAGGAAFFSPQCRAPLRHAGRVRQGGGARSVSLSGLHRGQGRQWPRGRRSRRGGESKEKETRPDGDGREERGPSPLIPPGPTHAQGACFRSIQGERVETTTHAACVGVCASTKTAAPQEGAQFLRRDALPAVLPCPKGARHPPAFSLTPTPTNSPSWASMTTLIDF